MKRRIWLVVALLLLPCCFAAGEAGPPDRRSAGGFHISGVAVNSRDGSPIPFCRIQVGSSPDAGVVVEPEVRRQRPRRGMRMGEAAGVAARTGAGAQDSTEVEADAHGRFQVELPHAGWWSLSGSSRGFRRQNYDAHEDFYSSIAVTAAAPAMDVTLRLQPDAAISGVVLDEAGEPVRDVQVSVELISGAAAKGAAAMGHQVGFTQTDDRGMYEVAGLAPGSYRVRIQGQPWYAQASRGRAAGGLQRTVTTNSLDPSLDVVYPMLWFPGTEQEEQAEIIRLTGAEDRQADFHLQPIPASHIHFTLPDPGPAEGPRRPRQAGMMISRVSTSDGLTQNLFGNAEGDFGGIAPGTYEVRVQGADGRSVGEVRRIQIAPGSVGGIDLSGAALLTKVKVLVQGVADDAVGDVIFTDLASGRAINATVGGVRAMGRQSGAPGFAGVRGGGTVGADNDRAVFVAPGRYEVSLGSSGQSFVTGLTATGAQVAGLVVQVDGGSPVVTLQVASGKSQVAGVARMGGVAAAGAMVLLVPATAGGPGELAVTQRDQTNTDGSYVIRGVIPGRYILLAIDRGWDVNWHDPATLAMYLAHGVPLEIAPSSKVVREIAAQKP